MPIGEWLQWIRLLIAIMKLLDEWFTDDDEKVKIAANIMKALDEDGSIKKILA